MLSLRLYLSAFVLAAAPTPSPPPPAAPLHHPLALPCLPAASPAWLKCVLLCLLSSRSHSHPPSPGLISVAAASPATVLGQLVYPSFWPSYGQARRCLTALFVYVFLSPPPHSVSLPLPLSLCCGFCFLFCVAPLIGKFMLHTLWPTSLWLVFLLETPKVAVVYIKGRFGW